MYNKIITAEFCIYFSIAKGFSVYPGGRHREDGPYSAEELVEIIRELLDHKQLYKLYIDLDGTRGYASCFLHELATKLTKKETSMIAFTSIRKSYLEELVSYNEDITTMLITNGSISYKDIE